MDNITDAEIMKKYKIKPEDIETSKELLKAGRKL
jgi:hypothetical protein